MYHTLPPSGTPPTVAVGPRVSASGIVRQPSGRIQTVAAPTIVEAKPAAEKPTKSASAGISPRLVFLVTGVVLLGLVCGVPVVNAIMLIMDMNYVFWVGVSIPLWMIFLSLGVIVAYAITILVLFRRPQPQAESEQTMLLIANIFIVVLGLVFIFVAMPLSRQSTDTYDNIMTKCETSPQTMRTYEYAQVLQNIRSLPDCYSKYSVEECNGYEDAHPYTGYLKALERHFRCSGFCYRPPSSAGAALPQLLSNASKAVSAARSGKRRLLQMGRASSALTVESSQGPPPPSSGVLEKAGTSSAPPTLFSDANYQASCEGMAARDMKLLAGDIAHQTFYQGIYLVAISIAMGFIRLIGFCIRVDPEK